MVASGPSCRFLAVALTGLWLAGCSDASKEAPVSMKPGKYAMKLGAFGKPNEQLCFSSSDAANLDQVIRKYFYFYDDCTHKPAPRVGNSVSGTVVCKVDSTTGWDTSYTGAVQAEALTLNVEMVNYAPAVGSPNGREEVRSDGRVSAARIGECS